MRKRLLVLSTVVLVAMTIAISMNIYYYSDEHHHQGNSLAILNPSDINPSLVDSSVAHISEGHTIGEFAFLNQLGDTITQTDTDGRIYVADFFFTTCGSICPKMTMQFQRLQTEFKGDPHLKLLSHTVNPSYDTVEVMKAYADRFQADHSQWWFLTGSKESLYLMARKSYLVVPDENDPDFQHGDESDFIHTENFVLIDPDRRIRGIYDGTNEQEVAELIKDIYDLKKEYKFE